MDAARMRFERVVLAFSGACWWLSLGASGCGDDGAVASGDSGASPNGDAGNVPDGGQSLDGGRADAGGPGACKPSDCDGLPVPAIACADGPTTVVCERAVSGACLPSVRCGPRADGGAGADAGSNVDAGPVRDAGMTSPGGGQGLGKTCGGIAGLACAAGLFCDYAVAAGGTGCSGIADASGVCTTRPDVCPDIYAPVCGCNGRSYPSACSAHAMSAAVKHDGLCTADECTASGGRAVYSDGASTPACHTGEVSFSIPGKEPAICCVPGP